MSNPLRSRSAWTKMAIAIGGVAVIALLPRLHASAAQPLRQPAPDREAFEVASVKRNVADDAEREVEVSAGGRFSARDATLRDLIQLAYPNQDGWLRSESQIVSRGPAWIGSEHFDVIAKAGGMPGGFNTGGAAGAATFSEIAAVDRVRAMLRGFLAERFALIAHTEVRDLPVYALVLSRRDGRLGPRLHRVNVDCAALRKLPPTTPIRDRVPCGGFVARGRGQYTGHAVSMSMIAKQLSGSFDRIVVDRTSLGGVFDIDLEWNAEDLEPRGTDQAPPNARDAFGPSLVTALREQLGLKLESSVGPVDVLVIDRAEMPTPD